MYYFVFDTIYCAFASIYRKVIVQCNIVFMGFSKKHTAYLPRQAVSQSICTLIAELMPAIFLLILFVL